MLKISALYLTPEDDDLRCLCSSIKTTIDEYCKIVYNGESSSNSPKKLKEIILSINCALVIIPITKEDIPQIINCGISFYGSKKLLFLTNMEYLPKSIQKLGGVISLSRESHNENVELITAYFKESLPDLWKIVFEKVNKSVNSYCIDYLNNKKIGSFDFNEEYLNGNISFNKNPLYISYEDIIMNYYRKVIVNEDMTFNILSKYSKFVKTSYNKLQLKVEYKSILHMVVEKVYGKAYNRITFLIITIAAPLLTTHWWLPIIYGWLDISYENKFLDFSMLMIGTILVHKAIKYNIKMTKVHLNERKSHF